MKRLVIIGANDFQNQLILKAKSLGYETHVFAWEDGAAGKENADFFYPVSITEKEQILEICKGIHPDGVCTIASDLAAIAVSYIADRLGLPCNKFENIEIQTNKFRMREQLSKSGIDCPKFLTCDNTFNGELPTGFSYPIIVKPTDRSGSRCITKLTSGEGLNDAVSKACAVSFEKKAIIEEYIAGNEYSCECISQNGKHSFLAFTKKYTTGSPHFIETGHLQPADIPPADAEKIKNEIFKALDALKVECGASHSEFKIGADNKAKIIEIGARMGGDCIGSDLVYLTTGHDFMKMVIDAACGNEIDLSEKEAPFKKAEIRFLFDENDLYHLEKIKNSKSRALYRISDIEIENLGKTEDSSTRLGYYIITE